MNRRDFFGVVGKILGGMVIAPLLPEILTSPTPSIGLPDGWILRISNSSEFWFGFTGFKATDGLESIVGQIQYRGPVLTSRLTRQIWNVN